jgi:hypothetical protein
MPKRLFRGPFQVLHANQGSKQNEMVLKRQFAIAHPGGHNVLVRKWFIFNRK